MTLASDLKEIQTRLKALGLYNSKIDGLWGPKTYSGILQAISRSSVEPANAKVTTNMAFELAGHEAVVRQAYRDSAGVWTWSVGLTSATGHKVEQYIGQPQSLQHCMNVYVWALRNYARQVFDVFSEIELSETAAAGFISFHWNTGAIRRASFVNLYKQGMHKSAEDAFMLWNKPNLASRRKKEADLIWRGIWSNSGTIIEYTRVRGNGSFDFSSGTRIDIRDELISAFDTPEKVTIEQIPKPFNIPLSPTLTPET